MGDAPINLAEADVPEEVVVDAKTLSRAVDQTAVRITLALKHANPLVLCVMHGGLVYCGRLLERLRFPLELGYVHVARYGNGTVGGALDWIAAPVRSLRGREVLIVDDVLDRGDTLAAVCGWAAAAGAARVWSTVLVRKAVPGNRAVQVDFAALECPDRYLVGGGMDCRGYWRNLPDIRAVPPEWEDGGVPEAAPLRSAAPNAQPPRNRP